MEYGGLENSLVYLFYELFSSFSCEMLAIYNKFKLYFVNSHESYFPDVRTQAMFQLLDTGFVGLIFSCFSEDAQKV
jgi:hypothetical protein